jgi:phenolic acid decarboxylase
MAKIAQWLKGRVPKKKLVLPVESWVFMFFSIFVYVHGFAQCCLQYDHLEMTMKDLNVFKTFISFIVLEFFTLLVRLNLKLRFEQCMLNLI